MTVASYLPLGWVAIVTVAFAAEEFSRGWRDALPAEVLGETRNESPNGFTKAEGDFNGDGLSDTAYVLKSATFSGEALWVKLSQPGGGYRWQQLQQIKWPEAQPSSYLTMAVATRGPGVIAYACFDSAKECDLSPPMGRPKLKLQDPSLVYFKPESAASLFFWSNKHSRFLRVWLSD